MSFLQEPTLTKWLESFHSEATQVSYRKALKYYFLWIQKKYKFQTFSDIIADHNKCLMSPDPQIRSKHSEYVRDFITEAMKGKSYDYKVKLILAGIRSFYKFHRVELIDISWRFEETDEEALASRERRDVSLSELSKMINYAWSRGWFLESAVLLILLHTGLRVGDFVNQFNFMYGKIKSQLESKADIIKIGDFVGGTPKGKRFFYYCLMGKHAVLALKKYLEIRGPISGDGPIFVNKIGEPIKNYHIQNMVSKLAFRTGLMKRPKKRDTSTRYKWHPHAIRSVFKTECTNRGVANNVSEFLMGHFGGIDSLTGPYDRVADAYQEKIKQEYLKVEPFFNLVLNMSTIN